MALNSPDAGTPDFGQGFDRRKDVAFTLPGVLAFPVKPVDDLKCDFCRVRHEAVAIQQHVWHVDKMLFEPVSSPKYDIFLHKAGDIRCKNTMRSWQFERKLICFVCSARSGLWIILTIVHWPFFCYLSPTYIIRSIRLLSRAFSLVCFFATKLLYW